MQSKPIREELLELIKRLLTEAIPEDVFGEWILLLEQNTGCPHIADYIYYPEEDLTAEEILDKAFAYKPFITPPPSIP